MESNFRSALPNDRIFGGTAGPGFGGVAPPLPPRPALTQASNYYPTSGYGGMYGGGGYGGFGGGGFMNNYGYGGYSGGLYNSYNSYNSYGGGMYGNHMPYNQNNYLESRFIQIAEESSRPAFQSIESFVSVIGNFAQMLDSTFFGLTSSFRAILGVTANMGKLRAMFSQFMSSFALFKGLRWLWRKILYTLKISNVDPSSQLFKEAFAMASEANGAPINPNSTSAWPMLMFLGFIFSAPYLIMKAFGRPEQTQVEQDPRRWLNPIESQASHNFKASSAQELSLNAGESVFVAPKEIQNQCRLMNTGWALATKDFSSSGLIPINYIQRKPNNIPQQNTIFPASDFTKPTPTTTTIDLKANGAETNLETEA